MGDTGSDLNLTGVWQGRYAYPRHAEPVSFLATLIESGRTLSGTVSEPSSFQPGRTISAGIAGSRSGSAVSFVKTYDKGTRGYGAPVAYEGTISADATTIEGTWQIRGILGRLSGTFVMTRTRGSVSEVDRAVVATA